MRVDNNSRNRHFFSVGVSGSGKSYFTKKLIEKEDPQRLLIYDVKREFENGFLGAKLIYSLEKLNDILITKTEGKYIYQPLARDDYQLFCRLALAWGNCDYGDLYVYIEEAGSISNKGQASEAEYALFTQGRALGLIICYVSSNFQNATTTALQSVNNFRLGRQVPMSVKYVRSNLSIGLADKVEKLTGYDAFFYNQEKGLITQDTITK